MEGLIDPEGAEEPGATTAAARDALEESARQARMPWTRWWWHGSAVTAGELTRHLETYSQAGIGGVEITPIYGAKGSEDKYLPFLGDSWMEAVRHTIREGKRLGIGVDMTLGTGWPYGGAHLSEPDAPRSAIFHREQVFGGPFQKLFPGCRVEAAAWVRPDGKLVGLPADRTHEFRSGDPLAGGILYLLLSKPTGQQVKRAAPGGAGHVMCPFSKSAFGSFIAPYTRMFERSEDRPRAVFYDSFEAFEACFAPGFPERFLKETGRQLAEMLPALMGDEGEERRARSLCDYRNVLFRMHLEEGIGSWVKWARGLGIQSRYQAHGSPGNLIDLYAAADIPETELFGATPFPWLSLGSYPQQVPPEYPLVNKLASSAAHLCGKALTSSETFTWLREHFNTALADLKPEADLLFLSGINHIVLCGSTFSPQEAGSPGWKFYASTHFDPDDSLWRDLPEFNRYVAGCQEILQAGRLENDLLVYFPFHDVISRSGGKLAMQLTVHGVSDFIGGMDWGQQAMRLWNSGYAFDFVSDELLHSFQPRGRELANPAARFRAIVLPSCKFLPTSTMEKLAELGGAGVRIFRAGPLPESAPGMAGLGSDPGFAAARKALERVAVPLGDLADHGIHPLITPPAQGLRAIRIVRDGEDRVFVSNLSGAAIDEFVPVSAALPRHGWCFNDLVGGRSGRAEAGPHPVGCKVHLQLAPGESVWMQPCENPEDPPWLYKAEDRSVRVLRGSWRVEAVEGGPGLPAAVTTDRLHSWTAFDDRRWKDFSGTARYTLRFSWQANGETRHRLVFPAVAESVRVRLNGAPVGTAWTRPFELAIDDALRPGENELVCEVTNLSANRIAAMDRKGVSWRNFQDINFVSVHYKEFDASDWTPRPSGLLCEPEIHSFRPATECRRTP